MQKRDETGKSSVENKPIIYHVPVHIYKTDILSLIDNTQRCTGSLCGTHKLAYYKGFSKTNIKEHSTLEIDCVPEKQKTSIRRVVCKIVVAFDTFFSIALIRQL